MKRSEMVINIAIELMSRLPEWEKQERLDFASEILQSIEIMDMLPPRIKGSYELYGINVYRENNYWEEEEE